MSKWIIWNYPEGNLILMLKIKGTLNQEFTETSSWALHRLHRFNSSTAPPFILSVAFPHKQQLKTSHLKSCQLILSITQCKSILLSDTPETNSCKSLEVSIIVWWEV